MKKIFKTFVICAIAMFTVNCAGVSEKHEVKVKENEVDNSREIEIEENINNEVEENINNEVEENINNEVEIEEKPNVSLGQINALGKAKSYINFSGFSYSGLVRQLEFEGFSEDEIKYAMENLDVDWKEQAVRKAKSYLNFSSFSRDGLFRQLEFEGFSEEQIEYALEAVGY